MKCSKCGKEIVNIQTASCISGYDENGKHENWICEKCSFEWEKEHPCYPIDYDKKSITNFVCKKCGSTEYEIKDKPNGTGIAHGLYCAKCGFWHKWLGKEELKQYATKESKDEIIAKLQSENAALRERLNITKMALEYACLETLQSNEQYLEELKEKVNKYIKQSEDVVYGQKNGVTFRFAEARLAELKGEKE